jgi:hypothetical protein
MFASKDLFHDEGSVVVHDFTSPTTNPVPSYLPISSGAPPSAAPSRSTKHDDDDEDNIAAKKKRMQEMKERALNARKKSIAGTGMAFKRVRVK